MKKPTLEEVKEYFKDAKEVECLSSGIVVDISTKVTRDIHLWNGGFWIDLDQEYYKQKNVKLHVNGFGFAKILTTKEKTFTITAEQLMQLENGFTLPKLQEWFPEVFKTKLEVGKWYKKHNKGWHLFLFCFSGTYGNESSCGFDASGKWSKILGVHNSDEYVAATEKEVFEALKNESEKIGYKEGNYDCLTSFSNVLAIDSYFLDQDLMGNFELWKGKSGEANCIFRNGKWAKIIPTCTREEAEKLLNKKIID